MKNFLLVLIFLLAAKRASTCECGLWPSAKEEFKNSVLVLRGVAVCIDTAYVIDKGDWQKLLWDTSIKVNSMGTYIGTTFKVIQYYKGKLNTGTIRILSGTGNGDCGFIFEKGKEYIIYVTRMAGIEADWDKWVDLSEQGKAERLPPVKDHKPLYTDFCTRTDTFNYAAHKALLKLIRR